MEKIIAVLDGDPAYARRFADVANQKEKGLFTVVPFSTAEALREYSGRHRIEILLAGSQVPRSRLEGIPAGTVMTLSEGQMPPGAAGYPGIYKYQAADSVIREVMARYCEQPAEELFAAAGRRARVFGVYSPLGRCRKTSLALTVGQELARDGKVLYMSFDEFSGLSRLLSGEVSHDLSDVLYYLRQGAFNALRLRSLVHTWKDMDYIAPVRYPEDLEQMSGTEAAELLEKLASEAGYEYIVADVGRPAKALTPVLGCCDVIYMPVKEDSVSAARLAEFDQYLETAGRQDIQEKICRVKLPSQAVRRQEDYPEGLLWGELGDYVRKLLRGGAA